MNQIALGINFRVDDYTAEGAIIASNVLYEFELNQR